MAKWRFAINNTMYNLVAKNLANLQAKNPAFSLMTFLVGNASGRDSCKATDTNSGIQFAECEERGSRY